MTYDGSGRDPVRRSALVRQLLQHEPTGAVAAAATTSLGNLPLAMRHLVLPPPPTYRTAPASDPED